MFITFTCQRFPAGTFLTSAVPRIGGKKHIFDAAENLHHTLFHIFLKPAVTSGLGHKSQLDPHSGPV